MSGLDWTFFRAFVKSPMVVASAIPSSARLERRVVDAMAVSDARTIVEFGAGTGGVSRAILGAMPPDARLIAIEKTTEFVAPLAAIDDARFEVVNGCASTIGAELERRNLRHTDAIVSGIPFSTMPPDLCERIAANLVAALAPGGRFVAYQWTNRVVDYVAPHLGVPDVQSEIWNIPPMRVITWQKPLQAETRRPT